MLSDPQGPITITGYTGSPFTLYRVKVGDLFSVYQNADETVILTLSHKKTNKGRVIHEIRWDLKKIVTDPLTAANDYDSTTIRSVIDRPGYGFSVTEIQNAVAAAQGWLTGAMVSSVYGLQS
jgi:hypothetical protein